MEIGDQGGLLDPQSGILPKQDIKNVCEVVNQMSGADTQQREMPTEKRRMLPSQVLCEIKEIHRIKVCILKPMHARAVQVRGSRTSMHTVR